MIKLRVLQDYRSFYTITTCVLVIEFNKRQLEHIVKTRKVHRLVYRFHLFNRESKNKTVLKLSFKTILASTIVNTIDNGTTFF